MPQTDGVRLLVERVNLRLVLVVLVVFFLGSAALLWSGFSDYWKGREHWQALLRNLGAALAVTGALTTIWNFAGRRAFMDEVLAKAGIAKELTFAGIVRVTNAYLREVDWASLFRQVQKLDLFFAYARTWRHAHTDELQTLARRPGARIRVVLPDPEDCQTVAELARRFRCTDEELKRRVNEAYEDFRGLQSLPDRAAEVGVWFLPAAPQCAFYRFDRVGIISLYTHRRDRTPVPTFVVESGGTLYDFIRKEFDAMVQERGLARRVS